MRFAAGSDLCTPRPNANAYAERWVRTLRADCLDRMLIFGRRHLEHVLRVYRRHYTTHRPHRALQLQPPDPRDTTPPNATGRLCRRDLLGGLIHEYEAACEFANPTRLFAGLARAGKPLFEGDPLARLNALAYAKA